MSGPAWIFVGMIALFFGAMFLIYWVGVLSGRKAQAHVVALAGRLGLNVHEKRFLKLVTKLELTGTVQGRPVRVWHYSTGSGKSQKAWSAIGVRTRGSSSLTFRFAPQNVFSKLFEVFGSKEITVGDPVFDAAWHLQTNQAEFMQAALIPRIREQMMATLQMNKAGHLRCEAGEVVYAQPGGFSSEPLVRTLEAQLPLLLDLADVVEVSGQGSINAQ